MAKSYLKIVKASVQVMMSAISMTRFLDPIPPVFPPKMFGTDFLSLDNYCLVGGRPGLLKSLL